MKISVVAPLWQDRPASELLEVAINADRLGFSELWIGEMDTFDAFAFAAAVGLQSTQIALTIGPLAVSVRSPMTMAMGVASVAALCDRQTSLALGASSEVVVENWHGRARMRTSRHLDETAQIVRGLLAGEKMNFQGELATCKGYRLRLDPPEASLTIAAFGPTAVKVAARRADRMVLNMVTPASVGQLHSQLKSEAQLLGLPVPSLAVWLPCAVNPSRETIDQLKWAMVSYVGAPGYSDMMIEAGFKELVELARTRPHPKEVLKAMPDELISAISLLGSESEIDDQMRAYSTVGADEIGLLPATAGDPAALKTLSALSGRFP